MEKKQQISGGKSSEKDLETEFARLVREHKSTIYTVCYILVNLWRGFPKFEGRSDIRTWFYRVSLNTCITIDRKKKRNKSVPLSMNINLYEDNDADTKQVKMLYDRINKLGSFDRAIVLLWLEGISYDEIGEIVGISAKNVSVKLVRIREQLKKM